MHHVSPAEEVRAPSAPPPPREHPLAWVGPFAVFMAWLAVDRLLPLANPTKEVVRDVVLVAAIVGFSRRVLPTRAPYWLASIGVGLAVFALWVLPDVLVPQWRSHWLLQNAITGRITTSIPPTELTPLMLVLRTTRAALLVPVIEELFWRGWLPRWLQDTRTERVPMGRYTPFAFWATAALFAAEHGPFWEVGLVAGVVYNWWMRRTRSLGDLVLAHAVTNLVLSLYVVASRDWRFWM
ncbi:CAAX prenyl protease-related protein [Gemmatirosa kalamazoonensis]|uniref:CAAX prenyl protease-related protein n=1 Tax=Gemmatirosa kalamazoonensis TaxID=861299 RepID=W0RF77_9BACT|nr:CAAX prenyl protease-related protein [Gemmatirosa kalamazoonensis]AHG89097.1 CAAX prenyl protease-related protein [Gemmatirosa kalamazoonensis]